MSVSAVILMKSTYAVMKLNVILAVRSRSRSITAYVHYCYCVFILEKRHFLLGFFHLYVSAFLCARVGLNCKVLCFLLAI